MRDAAPIVIGALGGSGTRVAAQALIDSGTYLGSELNRARDNLVFTALFKRPRWFSKADEGRIHRQLDTFVRYTHGRRYGPGDYARLVGSVVDHDPAADLRESARRALAAVRSRPAGRLTGDRPWGWKEPNSHVYLPQLIDHFPGLRFVYVARHGLDMAYSRNKTQLHMWGQRFGVPPPADDSAAPSAQVEYWIAATRTAVELGRQRLGDRFLFLRYDDVCRAPQSELQRLLEFAGLPCDDGIAGRLAAGVRPPGSIGRWRAREDDFTPEQLAAVESFGFEVR